MTATTAAASTTAPAPAPTPAYDSAADFTRDRNFNAIGVRVVTTTSATGSAATDSRLDQESTTIGFSFVASSHTYLARYLGDMITAVTQAKTYPIGGYGYDETSTIGSSFIRSSSAIGTSYVGYADWIDSGSANQKTERILLFGSRTVSTDIPASGVKSYTGVSSTFGSAAPSDGRTATISVDWANRTVSVATAFQPTPIGSAGSSSDPISTPITMSGVLDPATGRISGTVTFNNGSATGTFEGALYGPRGAEAGIVFKVIGPGGTLYYGFVVAKS